MRFEGLGVWCARVVLALTSLLLSLLAAELGLRLTDVRPPSWVRHVHLETADKRRGLDLYPEPSADFDLDLRQPGVRERFAGFDLEDRIDRTPFGVEIRYTEDLCRGTEPSPSPGSRILVIGDSFTEGQGVREEDTFAVRLRRAGRQVLNCGRRAADFPELRANFDRHLAAHRPDLVIYALNLNDTYRSDRFDAEQHWVNDWIVEHSRRYEENPPPVHWWESWLWLRLQERLVQARVGARTDDWYRALIGEANIEGWARTVAEIREMNEAAPDFVVVVLPLLTSLDDYPFRAGHDRIVTSLRAAGVEAYDLLGAFEGADERALWVSDIDHHPNARGHARIARAVESILSSRRATRP